MSGIGIQPVSLHHTADPTCPACEFKMTMAHPELKPVWNAIKANFTDAHISWTFRDKINQEAAYANHKSHAHFPHSDHNKTDKDGNPFSHAIDLFQINKDNPKGLWSVPWCKSVYEYISKIFPYVTYGGKFKSISDNDHFAVELDESGSLVLPALVEAPIIIPAKKGTS